MTSNPFSLLCSIFLLYYFTQLLPTHSSLGNETDLLSLIAIKDRIEGLSSWNQSLHFCKWEGITCGNRHQRVIELNLSSHGLVGSVSPTIGNLSFLKYINLEKNKFYGAIPQEFGRLSRLQEIRMSYNAFEGEIPVNLSRCTELRVIDFRVNKLSGNVPAQLGSLPKLVSLPLESNNLTGEIPPSFGNLSSLQVLSLIENKLHGSIPDIFGRLSSLRFISLGVNRFSGKLPLSIYNLTSLVTFGINDNQLSGSLPSNMGITLSNLLDFSASSNQFSGLLPISLSNASNLQILDLPENNFTGQVPSDLGARQKLSYINLGSNYLGRGEIDDLSFISSLTNSSSLKLLSLPNNNFGGVLPDSIANLSTQMEVFQLGGNQISGTIPEGIANLVSLTSLTVEANHFHGNIPSSVGNLRKLQVLALTMNKFTGLIPNFIGNMTQLSELSLAINRLQGRIPSSLGNCQNLRALNLSRNYLNSTIPEQVIGISSLSIYLDFSQNSLTGSIPQAVGNLKNLGLLDLSGNKLSGAIPDGLGNCLLMEQLYLDNNLFVGKIPESLSSLRGLRDIDLSSNNFSGQIPIYFENYPYLERLNLSLNKLEGEVPMEGIFENANAVSVAGNFKLCGGIREMRLPTCKFEDPRKRRRPVAFRLAIAISVALFFLLGSCILILCWRRKSRNQSSISTSLRDRHIIVSYRDLYQATGEFSQTNCVGSGGFGSVYKGTLGQNDMIVAVKVFKLQKKGASKSFIAECESLRNIRHKNLVKILTCCSSTDFEGNDFKALVFEFMPNGNLEKWLYGVMDGQDDKSRTLNLLQRLNIVIDVASVLNYLHHECHTAIIHRDLKPSNVLLDLDMVAHVGDFGLAKLLSESMENMYENQSLSMGVKGSIGYAAPEYGMGGEASIKGDVYSYGILVLEVFIGRQPTSAIFKDGLNLHNYASNALPDQVTQIADPILLLKEDEMIEDTTGIKNQSLRRTKLLECITAVLSIGVACSVESPWERLDMKDVITELHSIRDSFIKMYGETSSS